jgi:hypothetical protein
MGIELISLHIPKTAGSTFWNYIQKLYGSEAVFHEDKDRILDPGSKYNIDPVGWRGELEEAVTQIGSEIRVIHGHFTATKYQDVFPLARRIVWLRHPVLRLISHYFFWKSKSKTVSKHTIHEYMEDNNLSIIDFAKLPMMRNILVNFYLKDVTLDNFDFVGIQEYFDQDLKKLCSIMEWPYNTPEEINRNIAPNYNDKRKNMLSDRNLLEALEGLNQDDMKIYNEALRLHGYENNTE